MTTTNWKDDFDKRYTDSSIDLKYKGDRDNIKNFIDSLLKQAQKETLEKYNKYLFEKGFVDDDIFNESPIEEYLSTK